MCSKGRANILGINGISCPMELMVVIQMFESLCAYWHSCNLDYVNIPCGYDSHCKCKKYKAVYNLENLIKNLNSVYFTDFYGARATQSKPSKKQWF